MFFGYLLFNNENLKWEILFNIRYRYQIIASNYLALKFKRFYSQKLIVIYVTMA